MSKEERQEKREKVKDFVRAIGRMTDEERQAYLKGCPAYLTCEGRALSPFNTIFIAMQSNGVPVTVVGGFRQWLRAGRCVKKGEHGFSMYFPMGNGKKDDGEAEDGDIRFGLVTVFDISQTIEVGVSG